MLGVRASASVSPQDHSTASVAPEVAEPRSPHLTRPERVTHDAMLPHKIALGEILVRSVTDGHVVAATNLYGRLVFERYPR